MRYGVLSWPLCLLAILIGWSNVPRLAHRLAHRLAMADENQADLDFFESKIRPVLIEHCYACHSTEAATKGKLKGSLTLDSRDGVRRGGDSGPAIVPGDALASLLWQSLQHGDDAPQMPPDKKLPANVLDDFRTWITRGAADPRNEVSGPPQTARLGMSVEEGRQFWSLRQPQSAAVPSPTDSALAQWPSTAVDAFVAQSLGERGLVPNSDALPELWLRRVTFDVIGLPPTIEEQQTFLADKSEAARAKVVDRLLASPRFGERWGRHWLDAVRYADSNGRDRNIFWYQAHRYRDYVLNAYDQDLPYDLFIKQQLAGDLMTASDRQQRDSQRIATGMLALGPKAFEEQKPDIFRMDVVDEQIELVGRSILGLSIGCARCHDHKFDPIPTKDYYALAGIFRSTRTLYGYGPKGIKATNHSHSPLYTLGEQADQLGPGALAYIERLNELTLIQNTARSDRYRIVRRVADAKLQLDKPGSDRTKLTEDIQRMEAEIKQWDVTVKAAEEKLQQTMDNPPPMPDLAMGVGEQEQVSDCAVHVRGETTNLGDQVPRGTLSVLPNQAAKIPSTTSGRLELAEWITSRENPLTARVYVNRVWQHLVGRGLVATPDDFGVNGALPTHPELLDYLAVQFMEEGWSTKRLLRHLLLSRTYGMSSDASQAGLAADPDNERLWRMSPRRLEVEPFRDAVLALSQNLDLARPGHQQSSLPNKLHAWRDVEYTTFKPQFLPGELDSSRRSVYLPVVRGVLPTIFQAFDFAAPDRPVAQREQSIVPAQSLYLMNSDWIMQHSRQTAERFLTVSQDPSSLIYLIYQVTLCRTPSIDELNAAQEFLSRPVQPAGAGTSGAGTVGAGTVGDSNPLLDRLTIFCQAIFASGEFRYLR
ncbi:MAG: PSD1 domain-containing protein [Pirellulaceae bacterium]|nr:PSD1 domain-containing protein [Pirellulaceae bacterium]